MPVSAFSVHVNKTFLSKENNPFESSVTVVVPTLKVLTGGVLSKTIGSNGTASLTIEKLDFSPVIDTCLILI